MTTHPIRRVALAAGLLITSAAAQANEYTRFETLVVEPVDSAVHCPTLGLLSAPPAWMPGDAAAVIVAPAATPGRDRLVAALVAEDAAVFELGVNAACDPIRSRPGASPPPLAERIVAAQQTLRAAIGPGLLVGIGFAEAGATMLGVPRLHAAVAMPWQAAPDGTTAQGSRLAATVRAGQPVAAAERGDARWPRFCAVLADAGAGPATDCVAALHPAAQLAARR